MRISSVPRVARVLAIIAAVTVSGCGQESAQSLTEKGQADLDKKDARSAVVRLKAALQAEPGSTAARVLLGRALLESGDPSGAALELSKSLDQGAKQADVLPALAQALLLSGQAKKLATLYGDVKLEDKRVDAMFRTSVATAWALVGDKAKTETALAAALSAAPDLPEALILKARLMAGRGEFDGALAIVEQVLSRDAKSYEAWHLKGEIQIYAKADPEGAEASFRKAVESEKSYVPARLALISARIRARDLPAAKKQLEELRAVAPNNPETTFVEAQIAYFDKDFAKTRDLVQRLLRLAPDNTGLLQLSAAVEWQTGSLVLAERQLSTALQLDPTLIEARTNLAQIYLRLGQPSRALAAVKPLLEGGAAKPPALAAAGEAALQLGDLSEAEGYFSKAAAVAPDDPRARTALALTQLALGESGTAFTELESLASRSKDTYVDIALVSVRLRRNELDAALAAVDNMVRKNPDSASAYELRGRVLVVRGEDAAARQAYEKALTLDPRLFLATAALAEIDMREKQPDKARQRFEEVLKNDPRNHLALMWLADLRYRAGAPLTEVRDAILLAIKAAPEEPGPRLKLIELLAGQRQVKAALTAAQEASAALPNDVQVLDALGRALVADGNMQQALSTFRRITTLDTNSAMAHTRMAEIHRAEGNRGAAVASLRRALEIDPRLKAARLNLVDILVEEKRSKEAIEIAKELQRREPTSSGGYLLEGAVYRRMKNNDASIPPYRLGLQRATDRNELAMNLFVAVLASGNWKQAETFGLDWVAKNPGDGAMQYQLGEGYMMQKDMPGAERHFAQALKIRPDFVPAINNLAWVLVQQGKPGGVELAQKAVDLLPGQPALLDTLASAQSAAKQTALALETQQKAVAMSPGEPALRLHLAKIALEAGDKTLAKSELERLTGASTRGSVREEAVQLLKTL